MITLSSGTHSMFHICRRNDIGYEVRACRGRPLGQWATMLAAMLGHGPANWWSLPPMKTKFVLASAHACSGRLLGMRPASTGQSRIEAGDLPAWCSTRRRC